MCPTLYWSERGAQFVVSKVADGRYRSLFFYSDAEQYGTGRVEYDDLENCVLTLPQVQSDHERHWLMFQLPPPGPTPVPTTMGRW